MKKSMQSLAIAALILTGWGVQADPKVTVDYNANEQAAAAFTFKTVPAPAGSRVW